jgi:BASS family bile acid:Na+ symporter
MFMALTLLANYKMSFTPAIYTLIMLFTAGVLVKALQLKFHSAQKNLTLSGLVLNQLKNNHRN